MKAVTRAYIDLHIAVILFGFTAILGKVISLEAFELVWWRVLLTSISLLFLIRFGSRLKYIPRIRILQFMGIGVIVGLHWLTFFGSIKFSNASICLVCMATTSFFTSLTEPVVMGTKFKRYEIFTGFLIIPAMLLIVDFNDLQVQIGIILGLVSAFLASLFGAFNKKLVFEADTLSITFLELSSAWLFLLVCIPFIMLFDLKALQMVPVASDWVYLLILALLCTTLAYVLALRSLKVVSAFAANLVVNLEPVYGILLAILILNEHKELPGKFYLGFFIIVGIVLTFPYIRKRYEPEEEY